MKRTEVNVNRIARLRDFSEVEFVSSPGKPARTTIRGAKVVELHDGSVYVLPKENPRLRLWLEFLESNLKSGDQIYVEAEVETEDESETRVVRDVLPIYLRFVNSIRETAEDPSMYKVVLLPTPSPLNLDRNNPRFPKLFAELNKALQNGTKVLATIRPETLEIVDVREHSEQPSPPEIFNGPLAESVRTGAESFTLEFTPAAITFGEALELFDLLASESSIPFRYLIDCCASRAHLMCELLRRQGVQSGKIWNYASGFASGVGTLTGAHEDRPQIQVNWTYHVAPVVSVLQQSGRPRLMVLDPSMLGRPRFTQTWRARQGEDKGDGATHQFSGPQPWFLFPSGDIDPDVDFSKTRAELRKHKQNLDRLDFNN